MSTSRSYVTIVSGMPRSGTSLMMRMLEAGGIPALTDGRRPADRAQSARLLRRRPCSQARPGFVVDRRGSRQGGQDHLSLAAALAAASRLPRRCSWNATSKKSSTRSRTCCCRASDPAAGQDRDRMIRALSRRSGDCAAMACASAEHSPSGRALSELIANPDAWANRIAQFLDGGLDEAAMAAVVEPRFTAIEDQSARPRLGCYSPKFQTRWTVLFSIQCLSSSLRKLIWSRTMLSVCA